MENTSGSLNRPIGYPSMETNTSKNMVTNAGSYSNSRYGDEIGWDHGDFSPKGNPPYMIRWKSGKRVDHRLLMILESFSEEIYSKRKDFFKKIFPEKHEEYEEVFERIEAMLHKNNHKVKSRTVQRSLSFGSNRLKLGKFKLKTPSVFLDVESPDDCQGVQSGTK